MNMKKSYIPFAILFLLLFINPTNSLTAEGLHFNSSFQQYKNYTIETTGELLNYQFNITVDTATLISEGKLNADCSNSKFAYYNSTTANFTEIPMYLSNLTGGLTGEDNGCNDASTVYWGLAENITSDNLTVIGHFYNGPIMNSVSDGRTVFIIFDDYLGSSVNTTQWNETGTDSSFIVANGLLSGSIGTTDAGARLSLTADGTQYLCTYCLLEGYFRHGLTLYDASVPQIRGIGVTTQSQVRQTNSTDIIVWGYFGGTGDTMELNTREGGTPGGNNSNSDPGINTFNLWSYKWNSSIIEGSIDGTTTLIRLAQIIDVPARPFILLENGGGGPQGAIATMDVDWVRMRNQPVDMSELAITASAETDNVIPTTLGNLSTTVATAGVEGIFFANFSFDVNSSAVDTGSVNITLSDGGSVLVNNATMTFNETGDEFYRINYTSAISRVIDYDVYAAGNFTGSLNTSDSVTVSAAPGGGDPGGGGGPGGTTIIIRESEVLEANPTDIIIDSIPGGSGTKIINIKNIGNQITVVKGQASVPWLLVSPSEQGLAAGGNTDFRLTYSAPFEPGEFTGELSFFADEDRQLVIPITMTIRETTPLETFLIVLVGQDLFNFFRDLLTEEHIFLITGILSLVIAIYFHTKKRKVPRDLTGAIGIILLAIEVL